MLDFSHAAFRFEPYPIGVTSPVMDEGLYKTLVDRLPPQELFTSMGADGYNKWTLSERFNPQQYHQFLRECPPWREVYKYVKSAEFVHTVFQCLATHRVRVPNGVFASRFEFSNLPADGGFLAPHRDIPSKVVTLIIPTMRAEEWKPAWGGGTDMLRPVSSRTPFIDYQVPREAFDLAESFAYVPNQCVIFIKTDNSWHSVGPIQGPAGRFRKTITVNIERVKKAA